MKQVIFVCLLSLSVCLSQPSTPLESSTKASTAPPATEKQPNNTQTATETKDVPKQTEHPVETANETSTKPTTIIAGPKNDSSPDANATKAQNGTGPNETSSKTSDAKAADNSSSTTVKPTGPVKPEKDGNNETKSVTPAPATNGTKADGKDGKKNETTTPKGENVSPTAAPVEAKTRAFDGPSFIGGIILTLGLLAIGFMGFKYYKNQTERNYHTL